MFSCVHGCSVGKGQFVCVGGVCFGEGSCVCSCVHGVMLERKAVCVCASVSSNCCLLLLLSMTPHQYVTPLHQYMTPPHPSHVHILAL